MLKHIELFFGMSFTSRGQLLCSRWGPALAMEREPCVGPGAVSNLPHNLPCAASPANHWPARPRAQRTSP